MSVLSRVREIYERRPYPPPSSRQKSSSWALGAAPWLEAVSEKMRPTPPARILVAGCGVGTEAFDFARHFPAAQVVGVDFSPRSIDTARRLLRRSDVAGRVAFEVADLSSADLPQIAGRKFDLISCHGVLSYIPDLVAVFRNFARCVTPDGLVAIGVNGAAHLNVRWRRVLPSFDISPGEFHEGRRMRQVLSVFDSITRHPPVALAGMPAGYLAGDIFGPLNRSLTLAEWLEFSRAAGLHFLGTYNAYFAIRALLNGDLHQVIMPRSRAEVAALIDALEPASFHHIVLSRRAPREIPWSDGRKLLSMRPAMTALCKARWPRRRSRSWNDLQKVVLESAATGTKITLDVPRWEIEILKNSDGERSLREILDPVKPPVPARTAAEALYLLYQLAVINLHPSGK